MIKNQPVLSPFPQRGQTTTPMLELPAASPQWLSNWFSQVRFTSTFLRWFNSIVTASAAGTYPPTLTAVANVTLGTIRTLQFSQVGNVVTVSGRVTMTPTAAGGTYTEVGVSLPVASAFTDAGQAGGAGSILVAGAANMSVSVLADVVNGRVKLAFGATNAIQADINFSFTYIII